MNRPIKFKVWFPTVNFMSDAFDIINLDELRALYWKFSSIDGMKFTLMKDTSAWKYIFRQYTGLKDKNGVEIYEGDIIRFERYGAGVGKYALSSKSIEVAPVIFDNGYFCLGGEINLSLGYLIDSATPSEVIGNIYQNPGLEEGKEVVASNPLQKPVIPGE